MCSFGYCLRIWITRWISAGDVEQTKIPEWRLNAKNCQGVSIFDIIKIKRKHRNFGEIMSKHCPRAKHSQNPTPHHPACNIRTGCSGQHSLEISRRRYPRTKRTLSSQNPSFSSQIKVAFQSSPIGNNWRMRLFKNMFKSSKPRNRAPQSHGRIFPRLNGNGSRRAPWHSGAHRHPHQPKPHVLVDGSWCFGTAKLVLLNTGLVLLSSLWVDFLNIILNCRLLYLQVSSRCTLWGKRLPDIVGSCFCYLRNDQNQILRNESHPKYTHLTSL